VSWLASFQSDIGKGDFQKTCSGANQQAQVKLIESIENTSQGVKRFKDGKAGLKNPDTQDASFLS
jgi:hypothetical protein